MPTLLVTAPPDAGIEMARTLVDERLAACVNRIDCRSTYRWEGDVTTEDEVILLIKTTVNACSRVEERVLALHPHETPCIERFDESDIDEAFGDWRDAAVDSR